MVDMLEADTTYRARSTTIGIGFSGKSVSLSRAPGWEPESWGYHGDDGNSFAAQNVGKHYGPPFTTCDTVGCGVNFRTGCAFFTKNGVNLGRFQRGRLPWPLRSLGRAALRVPFLC